ncbi:MAG: hypothetical protein J6Q27_00100, partial [Clostridia bacterium]|nr:hypothetical protein [Clostridia bacterium]
MTIMSDLMRTIKNGWEYLNESDKKDVFQFGDAYIQFLNHAKTERLAIKEAIKIAETNGFCDISQKQHLVPGDKVYFNNRDKGLCLFHIGTEDISSGIHFVIAHVDSPRLDLKANPLYEDAEMALLKTHYYGGIKKYQWTAVPLSLIGVVYKKDGRKYTFRLNILLLHSQFFHCPRFNNHQCYKVTDTNEHPGNRPRQKQKLVCVE